MRPDVDPDGVFDVVVHGGPNGVSIDRNGTPIVIDHRVAADLIRNDPSYGCGPVRLLSCSTGQLDDGFAQNLANRLGVEVSAPDDLLWFWPDGQSFIGPRMGPPYTDFPDLSQPGSWRTFQPGGGTHG